MTIQELCDVHDKMCKSCRLPWIKRPLLCKLGFHKHDKKGNCIRCRK